MNAKGIDMTLERPLRSRRPRAAGFTLIELLVAIAILGILGTVVLNSVWQYQDEARQTGTKTKLDTVRDKVQMYRRKHNALPKWPEDMLAPDNWNGGLPWLTPDEILDAWGNQMLMKTDTGKAGQFEIVSLGADNKDGGDGYEKDLSSEHPINEIETNR